MTRNKTKQKIITAMCIVWFRINQVIEFRFRNYYLIWHRLLTLFVVFAPMCCVFLHSIAESESNTYSQANRVTPNRCLLFKRNLCSLNACTDILLATDDDDDFTIFFLAKWVDCVTLDKFETFELKWTLCIAATSRTTRVSMQTACRSCVNACMLALCKCIHSGQSTLV